MRDIYIDPHYGGPKLRPRKTPPRKTPPRKSPPNNLFHTPPQRHTKHTQETNELPETPISLLTGSPLNEQERQLEYKMTAKKEFSAYKFPIYLFVRKDGVRRAIVDVLPTSNGGKYLGESHVWFDKKDNHHIAFGMKNGDGAGLLKWTRTIHPSNAHIMFYTCTGDDVVVYDPNGRASVLMKHAEVRINIRVEADLVTDDTITIAKKRFEQNDKNLKEMKSMIQKLEDEITIPNWITNIDIDQDAASDTPVKSKRKLFNPVKALTEGESNDERKARQQIEELSKELTRLQRVRTDSNNALDALQKQKITQFPELSKRIQRTMSSFVSCIRDDVYTDVTIPNDDGEPTAATKFMELKIVGNELKFNKDGVIVPIVLQCVQTKISLDIYKGYSDSWVHLCIQHLTKHINEDKMQEFISKYDDVDTGTKHTIDSIEICAPLREDSETVRACNIMFNGKNVTFAGNANFNMKIHGGNNAIDRFAKKWFGFSDSVDKVGICASLALVFLLDWMQHGHVKTFDMVQETDVLFLSKEDGEIRVLLYVIHRLMTFLSTLGSDDQRKVKESMLGNISNLPDEFKSQIKEWTFDKTAFEVTATLDEFRLRNSGGDGNVESTGSVNRRESIGFVAGYKSYDLDFSTCKSVTQLETPV